MPTTSTTQQENRSPFMTWLSLDWHLELFAIIVLALCVCCYVGYTHWSEDNAIAVLDGPGQGANQLYYARSMVLWENSKLGVTAQETRSPGAYLAVIDKWLAVADTETLAHAAPWVLALQAKERADVIALLAQSNISVAQLKDLRAKLDKISPQLSDSESKTVKTLTDWVMLNSLSQFQVATLKQLFIKLHALGANDTGLGRLGLENKPDGAWF